MLYEEVMQKEFESTGFAVWCRGHLWPAEVEGNAHMFVRFKTAINNGNRQRRTVSQKKMQITKEWKVGTLECPWNFRQFPN